MKRPCTCQGTNENCRYCSGLGEISIGPPYTGAAKKRPFKAPLVQSSQAGNSTGNLGKSSFASSSASFEMPSHSTKEFGATTYRKRTSAKVGKQLWKCPFCKYRARKRKVDRHVNEKHSKPPQLDSSRAGNGHQNSYSQTSRNGQFQRYSDTHQLSLAERKLDATRDYARSFRENGRYGSHASHDDYGDESGS